MNNEFIHKLSVVLKELLKKFTSHFDFQQSLVNIINLFNYISNTIVNHNQQLITNPQFVRFLIKIIFISVISIFPCFSIL